MTTATEELTFQAQATGVKDSVLEHVTRALHDDLKRKTGLTEEHMEVDSPVFFVTLHGKKKDAGKTAQGSGSTYDQALSQAEGKIGKYDSGRVDLRAERRASVPYHTIDFTVRALNEGEITTGAIARMEALRTSYGARLVPEPEATVFTVHYSKNPYTKGGLTGEVANVLKSGTSKSCLNDAMKNAGEAPKDTASTVFEAKYTMKVWGPEGERLAARQAPSVITDSKTGSRGRELAVAGAASAGSRSYGGGSPGAGRMPYEVPKPVDNLI